VFAKLHTLRRRRAYSLQWRRATHAAHVESEEGAIVSRAKFTGLICATMRGIICIKFALLAPHPPSPPSPCDFLRRRQKI
jgi:hypothetical protein